MFFLCVCRLLKDMRIALIGMPGSGKSSVANAILKSNCFDVNVFPVSTAIHCESKERDNIAIVEMPGNFLELGVANSRAETLMCMEMAEPGPHVFLLVIRVGTCSQDIDRIGKWIKENFGEKAFEYAIVLFSYAEQLEGRPIEDFIARNNKLRQFINKCQNRYHTYNKMADGSAQVNELMEKINFMLRLNQYHYYTKEMYRENERENEIKEVLIIVGVTAGACLGLCVVGALANNH